MLNPNLPPLTPDWTLPDRCQCACLCAVVGNWADDKRRWCGCCTGSCAACAHGVEQPDMWQGDQA